MRTEAALNWYDNQPMTRKKNQPPKEGHGLLGYGQRSPDETPVEPADSGKMNAERDADGTRHNKREGRRKPLSHAEIWAVVLGILGILVAGATGLAVYWQAKIASGTLAEIRKQYPQLAKSTNAAAAAAGAAKLSAGIAASQLQLSERPWIYAQVGVRGPLTYTRTNGARLRLTLHLDNVGKSPALETTIVPIPFVAWVVRDPTRDLNRACKRADGVITHFPGLGTAVFPGSPIDTPIPVGFGKDLLARGSAGVKGIPTGTVAGMGVAICIAYRSQFNASAIYHTTYIMDLFRKEASGKSSSYFKIGDDISAARLSLRASFFNPSFAD